MTTFLSIRQKAYNLFQEGKGYKACAKELGLSESTVRDWFRRFRADYKAYESLLNGNPTKNKYPAELKKKAMRLKKEGLSWTEIMGKTGVSLSTLKNWGRMEKKNDLT